MSIATSRFSPLSVVGRQQGFGRRAGAKQRGEASATERQRALTWAQRLERVFAIEIETCRRCGARLRVIASIESAPVIERIFHHLDRNPAPVDPAHPSRAPPQRDLSL